MKGGKEMVKAVLKYRRMMQEESEAILQVPIRDPRTEEEKKIDKKLQEIAHRFVNSIHPVCGCPLLN